jgi:uncharacterized protein YkwD
MSVRTLGAKKLAVIAVAAIVSLGLTGCLPDTWAAGPTDATQTAMWQALNQDRANNGLPALTWSPKLNNLAGIWAQHMAAVGTLYHQDLGAVISTADFQIYHTLGENILVGPGNLTPAQMEAAWMASAGHRANILSPYFNIVGIAVAHSADGRIWAVVDFGGI